MFKRTVLARAVSFSVGVLAVATVQAAPAGPVAKSQIVRSGHARFEVLGPKLIRTEYAGDDAFADGATFNAIGRDGFKKAAFTATTTDGWLTIATSDITLKYKVGSGLFTPANLQVQLTAGPDAVVAAPWQRRVCAADRRCEAEDGRVAGPALANDHVGYTGRGFLAGFQSVGDSVALDLDVPSTGVFSFDARYANATGGDGRTTTRTLSLSVDGGAPQTLSLPVTANWDTWAVATLPLNLGVGKHTITLSHDGASSGYVNVDSLAIASSGAGFPTTGIALDCRFGAVCEGEDGLLAGSALVQSDHPGFAGTGFVGGLNQGAGITAHVVDVPAAGSYQLQLRYANATGGDGLNQARSVQVTAGGASRSMTLPVTGDWNTWATASVTLGLQAGANDIVLGCPDPASCHVNIDTLAVAAAASPPLVPHLALGGYRRGLDGVNDGAPTAPGLLYRDGWYLLDDTATALYDGASHALAARPAHPGAAYQDGYVFAHGHDFAGALKDLATLTGPSLLLPRWAYGVWYSEYYDRTAADYENVILPQFRADGVPLDVLVTDTDFKSPSTWDGWEMDPAKFPDPKGFFDWSRAQGLHNTLNIHSSIVTNDPQYAQAQATAKNKLAQSGCDTCHVFDWSDPDQLAAYFGLHQQMEQQGADFWWLDWCCDNSYVSRSDVTADAWINEKYAEDANKLVGRGFAFSRAYGSLTWPAQLATPTGPWADKRTTVHFTGDTGSNWTMLAYEVGYTPGESAATGLAAVSHDIGGFNNVTGQAAGAEPGSTRLPDDLYARWVQLGTFQPILRLHGNHSDRLPWQYGATARASAESFLRLREALVPTTYTLARQAEQTGLPIVRATWLAYPEEASAYASSGSEYFYGPDLLVAPVTSPGTSASTAVWFPPGSWTDFFSGRSYTGGSTQSVTDDLGAMPVFLRAGAPLVLRADNAANDVQNPMASLAVTVATGAAGGSFKLYEDDGSSANPQSASTKIRYVESGADHTLTIGAAAGTFAGQVTQRAWVVNFVNAGAPSQVTIDGVPLAPGQWTYVAATRRLSVPVATRPVGRQTVVGYR